mgnify:CR=1 FL=1
MSARRYDFVDEGFLARLERLHLLAKRLAAQGAAGVRRSRGLGDGLEFADHRDYAPGDDIRFIDWSYFARMEKLLLRMFHEHRERDVVILLDASGSMAPALPGAAPRSAKFDYARQVTAALAYVAMGALERVVVQPFADRLGGALRSGRNRLQVLEILDFLAALRPTGRTELLSAVTRLARAGTAGTRRGGMLLLVSDLLDAADELPEALSCLRAGGFDVTVIHVRAPEDAEPLTSGPVSVRDAETGRRLDLDVNDALQTALRERFEAFASGCEQACKTRGATYVSAPTDLPFDRFVLHTLRRAGVVAG